MKRILLLIAISLLTTGCDKDDDCGCYYSDQFNQYIPNTIHDLDERLTEERMDALAAECRNKGCN